MMMMMTSNAEISDISVNCNGIGTEIILNPLIGT